MKQIWIPRFGAPEVFEVRSVPDVCVGDNEVRIDVCAVGVNFADVMARMGIYPDGPPAPCVIGYEVAGVIDQIGRGVPEAQLGQRVVAMTHFGGYSSQVIVPAGSCLPLPDSLGFADGVAIPVAGLTSWMILEEMHRIREGDRVLIHAAAGGVGLMAGQLVKRKGGIAVGTASKSKHAFLQSWGYDQLIDYHCDDYEQVLQSEPKFDLVMDPLGGHNWSKGLRLLRPGGKVACYGMSVNVGGMVRRPFQMLWNVLRIPFWSLGPLGLINQNKGVFGVNMGRLWSEQHRLSDWLRTLIRWVDSGDIRVKVHTISPFEDVAGAHRLIHDHANLGKVVLTPRER
ncbi:MAG: zinc-binding dehydrogenase [Myxococcales bacterium]|nr:zinc-binding dehydrogenase [Myxococcales bacterium]